MKLVTRILCLCLMTPYAAGAGDSLAVSLSAAIQQADNDSLRVELLLQMGDRFEHHHFDSALYYYRQALQTTGDEAVTVLASQGMPSLRAKTIRYIAYLMGQWEKHREAAEWYMKSLEIYRLLGEDRQATNTLLYIGNAFFHQGMLPEAEEYYKQTLESAKEAGLTEFSARALQNLGNVTHLQGRLREGMSYYQQALDDYEKLQDVTGVASCYIGLGNSVLEEKRFDRARFYYQEARLAFEKAGHRHGEFNAIMNLGTVFLEEGQYDPAVSHFELALEKARMLEHSPGILRCYHNLGLACSRRGDKQRALEYYTASLSISRASDNFIGLASTLGNMASLHNDLGQYREALAAAGESLDHARRIESIDDQRLAMHNLARAYEGLGRYREALVRYQQYKVLHDSVQNLESRKHINQLEASFHFESMQQQLDLQTTQLEKQALEMTHQAAEVRRQKLLRNALIMAFSLLALLFVLVYMNLRQRRKAGEKMALQKQRVEEANTRLLRQFREIQEARNAIASQKQQIDSKNQSLLAGIRYARDIQQALLPGRAEMERVLGSYFLVYKPRDIVGGDFYWACRTGRWAVVALGDATGHGVPGAFISLLALTFLKELSDKGMFSDPGDWLCRMFSAMESSLQGNGREGHSDGVDAALLAIDHENKQVLYAGSRCPLYVASGKDIRIDGRWSRVEEDGPLRKVHPALMPRNAVAGAARFSNHDIRGQAGDRLYLLTDGLADQMGGENRQRFTSRRVSLLLGDLWHLPLQEQEEKWQAAFRDWKGALEQVDDVSVLGIEL